jgi:hypothetical protein
MGGGVIILLEPRMDTTPYEAGQLNRRDAMNAKQRTATKQKLTTDAYG